jgi:2,6-dihydroxypyridine 3-monooxygenase
MAGPRQRATAPPSPPLRIVVVGGSIGGLTAALLLRDLGHDVSIHERSAAELVERGAGIGLLETTSRYLVQRGGLSLDEVSIATDHIRYLHRDGTVAHHAAHSYRFSSWTTVYRRLLSCWGSDRYHLSAHMVGFDQDDDGVEVRFEEGAVLGCHLLVCADGVGSSSRTLLVPGTTPVYSGYVAWRGTVPEADMRPATAQRLGDAITYYVLANSHILVYPIPGADGSLQPGRRLLNFVWYRNYLHDDDLDDLMTDVCGARRDISLPPGSVRPEHASEVRAVATARLPRPLAEVVTASPSLFVQVIQDIEVRRMAFGRVCLLGDAAFAVRPHAAAGSAKAAADGWALAAALEEAGDDVPGALAAWEPGQLDLGRRLLERTRRIGSRSQFEGSWDPADPELIFGLEAPGR